MDQFGFEQHGRIGQADLHGKALAITHGGGIDFAYGSANFSAAALLRTPDEGNVETMVVLRGLSFLGDALAHGVLPGIAIAFVLGASTTLGALVAAIVMVGGVQLIRTASPLPDDASIGVLFVGFLALAVVVMSS